MHSVKPPFTDKMLMPLSMEDRKKGVLIKFSAFFHCCREEKVSNPPNQEH